MTVRAGRVTGQPAAATRAETCNAMTQWRSLEPNMAKLGWVVGCGLSQPLINDLSHRMVGKNRFQVLRKNRFHEVYERQQEMPIA